MDYFTQRHWFGSGFNQMRAAMRDSVEAFASEGHGKMPNLPDGVSLAAQFIAQVTPGQGILSGTTAYRVDKIESYLSKNGPEQYFKNGLGVGYSADEAKQLADTILEEILGVYQTSRCSLSKSRAIRRGCFERQSRTSRRSVSVDCGPDREVLGHVV